MSPTMKWQIKLDPEAAAPIWSQIAAEITRNIARFRPEEGTPVISERQLAEMLRLHRNTVRRAYAELLNKRVLVYRNCRAIVIGPGAKELFRKPFPTVSLVLHRRLSDLLKEFSRQGLEIFGAVMDRSSELGMSLNMTALPAGDASGEEIDGWIEANLMRSVGIINFGPGRYSAPDPLFERLTALEGIPQIFVCGHPVYPWAAGNSVSEDDVPGFYCRK